MPDEKRDGVAKTDGYAARLEKYQQLSHRHAPSFIRHVLDAFRQHTLTANQAAEQLGLSPSRLYALATAYNTARVRQVRRDIARLTTIAAQGRVKAKG